MPPLLEKRHYKTCPRILHVPNILISIDSNTENKSILITQPNISTIKLINFDAILKICVICARFENSMGCKLINLFDAVSSIYQNSIQNGLVYFMLLKKSQTISNMIFKKDF